MVVHDTSWDPGAACGSANSRNAPRCRPEAA